MDITRIDAQIASGEFQKNPVIVQAMQRARQAGRQLHLFGLVSDGGVHSHQDHAEALAKILDRAKVPVWVHAITDGRDMPPQSAADDLNRLIAAVPQSIRIQRVRTLLRDGSRQTLGSHREGLQGDCGS